MIQRNLHLACYDVCDRKRLASALKLARAYATGGQKSVHEIFLSDAEKERFLRDMKRLLDLTTDRFMLLRLDPRSAVLTLGKATAPANPDFFCVS